MLMPFLMCYLLYCQHKRHIVINSRLIATTLIMMFFILYGRFIFAYYLFSDNPMEMLRALREQTVGLSILGAMRDMVGNLAYPFISVDAAFESTGDGSVAYRYFKDIPMGILFYTRLIGFQTDYTVSYYNTYALTGRLVSHVPPSIIGLGVYSLGWFGIAIVGVSYGAFLRYVRSFFIGVLSSSPAAVYKLLCGILVGGFAANGDPRVFTLKAIPLLLGLQILIIQQRYYSEKTKRRRSKCG